MIRLVVTGGREFTDAGLVERALGAVHRKHNISTLIEGGQRTGKRGDFWGADWLCRVWAEHNAIEVETFEAAWGDVERPGAVLRFSKGGMPYDAAAGGLRNQRMIDDGCPDYAVAFPGGSGTADMIRRLDAAAIPVWRVG